jgi:hypothetical protein
MGDGHTPRFYLVRGKRASKRLLTAKENVISGSARRPSKDGEIRCTLTEQGQQEAEGRESGQQ